jgi:ankyrin repeat protein
VEAGARLDFARTDDNCTPLALAVMRGHSSVAEDLVRAGANPDAGTSFGTPRSLARSHPDEDVLQAVTDPCDGPRTRSRR